MLSTWYGLWRYAISSYDIAYNIAKSSKYDGYQRGLASTLYKLFDEKAATFTDKSVSGSGVNTPVEFN